MLTPERGNADSREANFRLTLFRPDCYKGSQAVAETRDGADERGTPFPLARAMGRVSNRRRERRAS